MLKVWDSKDVSFAVRHKENLTYNLKKENELPAVRHQHLLVEQIIELENTVSKPKYPSQLRRVALWDEENQQEIEIITNNFKWAGSTIAELYEARWDVKRFFRDIKQQLHIKSFVGTSQNAVMIQIWTAMITILLLKLLKTKAKFAWYFSNLVAFIRLNLLVKIHLQKWLDKPFFDPPDKSLEGRQGVLFANNGNVSLQ